MNRRKFYQRISGILDPARLGKKKVAVIGLGSGGSRVAAELGRLGLALLLVERPGERLEEHNIVRHLLGYRSLGKSKLREVARCIAEFNPGVRLREEELDVVEQKSALTRLLEQTHPDLIAVCTDNEQSKHAINQMAVPLGVPQVGAGVYDGGIGGEVYKIMPEEACYGCIADYLQLARFNPAQSQPSDYSSGEAQEVPSTSALNLDIEQIALLQCRMILEVLLDEQPARMGLEPKINLCVFANRLVPGTFTRPLHAEFFSVPRRQDCLDCGAAPHNLDQDAERILAQLTQREKPFTFS